MPAMYAQSDLQAQWRLGGASGSFTPYTRLEMDLEPGQHFLALHGRLNHAEGIDAPITGTCLNQADGDYLCTADFPDAGNSKMLVYNVQSSSSSPASHTSTPALMILCSYDAQGNESGRAWGSLLAEGQDSALPIQPPRNCSRPEPELWVSPVALEIQIPQNCTQSIWVSNTGEPGSTAPFLIADNGAIGGFLEVTGGSRPALPAGSTAQVNIRVHPHLLSSLTSFPIPWAADHLLSVYASTGTGPIGTPEPPVGTLISVKVRDVRLVAQRLVGLWSGNWTGYSEGPNLPMQPRPQAQVAGSWALSIESVDFANMTVSGLLQWSGNDIYWASSQNQNGGTLWLPVPFVPDRTLSFSGTKGMVSLTGPQCNQFRVQVFGTQGAFNPSDAFYGPDLTLDIDTRLKVVSTGTFFSHPYNPVNRQTWVSTGTVSGSKH